MEDSRKRFGTHLESNLVHLHKNFYVNRSDPHYYEKIIRYFDPRSAEAHYRLGRQLELGGFTDKAIYHYNQAMKAYPSEYYYPAYSALRHLQQQLHPGSSSENNVLPPAGKKFLPPLLKFLLLFLLLINVLLVGIFYGPPVVSKAVSWVKPWEVGREVTYESTEKPFVLHFPYGTDQAKIESALHRKAIELAGDYPKMSITVYGLASAVRTMDNTAVPLTDDKLKNMAFVVAEYNPAVDTAVKIRFLNRDFEQLKPQAEAGANLVRTALTAYISQNGHPPESLELLTGNYPDNYISEIPLEPATGSALVRTGFDGSGGWVYNNKGKMSAGCFTRTLSMKLCTKESQEENRMPSSLSPLTAS
ncbi:hypothetical protein LJK88_39635 [Paenibacillus sp. P26]|nr:hypothetical protein LJK88_39635 [Paenibacillus sp. P26]